MGIQQTIKAAIANGELLHDRSAIIPKCKECRGPAFPFKAGSYGHSSPPEVAEAWIQSDTCVICLR